MPTQDYPVAANPGLQQRVIIDQVENGFVVIIGCKSFVGKTWEEVSHGLELYFKSPEEARKAYCRPERQV